MCAFCAGKSHLPRLVFKEMTGWEAAIAHVLPFKPFPFRNCLSGVGHRPLREDRTWWKRVEERERERERERTTNPQIVASCRCVQYPRKKKKRKRKRKKKQHTHSHTQIASVEICRASTIPSPGDGDGDDEEKQRCIHGAVTHPKHLYIPLTAQGVLLCGGYITSRTAEEAKRQQHRAAHAHKHTRKRKRKKRVSRRIWQGAEEEGEGGNLVREAPQGEEEKKTGV